jgi:hypothetical protein
MHFRLQVRADPQLIVQYDLSQLLDSALEAGDPGSGTCKPVGGADVEHEVSVDDAHDFGWRNVRGEQLSMPRDHAAVPTNEDWN